MKAELRTSSCLPQNTAGSVTGRARNALEVNMRVDDKHCAQQAQIANALRLNTSPELDPFQLLSWVS